MNNKPESAIEDRLRSHYRHLRTQPPADLDRRRQPRLLAGAACLVLVLVAGAVYVRNAEPGHPIEADAGVVADGSEDNSTGSSLTATTVATASTTSPEPTAATAPGSETTSSGSGLEADSEPAGTNIDSSPRAPRPGTGAPPAGAEQAAAYGIWEPAQHDTCSKAIHDRYWVYGPDSKVYPTYHPPTDPTSGCTFGHEHGRDPAGSDLADIPFPFGYVNEQAIMAGVAQGHEDHVGHKIEWYNDGGYYDSGNPNSNHDQVCDVAYKLHMGTHSADGFENNLHEVFHYARCDNGSELIYRALHPFGNQGEFTMHCNQQSGPTITVGQGNDRNDDRAGGREIPAASCFEDQVLVPEGQESDWFPFDERWTLYQSVDSDDFGRFFIQFYFFADLPSRYWDGEQLAHTVDLCYVTGARQVRDDEFCEPMRTARPDQRVEWDDPASPFNGADRDVFMIDIQLDNKAQQTDWHTDIHGDVWSARPFAGSIRQYVGTTPIHAAASYEPSPIRSITFDDDVGIHAPN